MYHICHTSEIGNTRAAEGARNIDKLGPGVSTNVHHSIFSSFNPYVYRHLELLVVVASQCLSMKSSLKGPYLGIKPSFVNERTYSYSPNISKLQKEPV